MGVSSGVQTTGAEPRDDGLHFHWWHAILLLLAVLVLGLVLFVTVQPVKVLPRMTLAPGYSLTDQNGDKLTSEAMRGKFTLYNFTYTNCAAPCPETGSAMRVLQDRLATVETGDIPVRLVTISFDAERDDAATMLAWAQANGADPAIWSVASGPAANLKAIIGAGFSAYYTQNEDGSFTFDPTFVLVDGNGIIRTKYRTAAPDPETFARDLGLISQEVANSSGASKLAYEAAHLFLCYPD